jgi:hypothetical protein
VRAWVSAERRHPGKGEPAAFSAPIGAIARDFVRERARINSMGPIGKALGRSALPILATAKKNRKKNFAQFQTWKKDQTR